MRLVKHLTEGNRSKPISEDEFYKGVKKECKKALNAYKKGDRIWRGIQHINVSDGYYMIDPKKGSARRSAHTSNYYTYVITNSPQWKKYPKRTRSIICSSDLFTAENFGYAYLVLPIDGAKIGVTPIWDFWGAFQKTLTDDDTLDDFNWQLEGVFSDQSVVLKQNSYSAFVKSLKEFDKAVKIMKVDELFIGHPIDKFFKRFYKGDLLKALQQAFDPAKNGFELKTIGDSLPRDAEVWTDAKSYMIGVDNMDDFNLRIA